MMAVAGSELPVKVTRVALEARILSVSYDVRPDGRTTVCEITMVNGFTVRGESSCAVAAEFREDFGRNYAYEDALNKAWAFEGYLLRDRRFNAGLPV